MRNNTVQQEEVRGMAVLDHVPKGWKVIDGCTNAPAGYYFINNNKGRHVYGVTGKMGRNRRERQ